MTRVGPGERRAAVAAHERGTLGILWRDQVSARSLAAKLGWPGPWFDPEGRFLWRMLASDEAFDQATSSGDVEVFVPRERYVLPAADLEALDASHDNPTSWHSLVESLREIRRAVEAGVVVEVAGAPLTSFQTFYDWADRRYYRLEDDTRTGWIGSD